MENKSSPLRLSSGTRAVVIYNPRSGTHDIQASLTGALEVFREQGWQIDVQRTQQAGDIQRYSVEARQAGYDVVLTAGGDGSLNEAANALAHSEVALGTLPSGLRVPGLRFMLMFAATFSASPPSAIPERFFVSRQSTSKPMP